MEVIYKSNVKNNYIVLRNSNIVVNDFRLNMLLKNSIKGFLPIYVGCVDGNVELSYSIDSKQSLKKLLERKKMNNDEVINVIKGIMNVIDLASEYLLKLEDIILDTELIFCDYDMKELWFCYYPNSDKIFYEELKKLSQELLIVTEHKDMQAVEIIYKFFDVCNSEDISIKKLEECLTDNEYKYYQYMEDSVKEDKVCEETEGIYNVEKKGKFSYIMEKIYEWFSGMRKEELDIDEFKNDEYKVYEGKQKNKEEENYKIEEYDNETILVSDIMINSNRKLLSLSDKEDIEITNYPFIIGKLNARADYIIDDKLISRMHIKIHKDREEFYLEDMNSKNGTFLNDIQLGPYEKKKLEIGDKITIAKYDFIFR